jgi:hypothetical protein
MEIPAPKYTIGQVVYLINTSCIRGANDDYTAYANPKEAAIKESCNTIITNERGTFTHIYYVVDDGSGDDDSIDEKYMCATYAEAELASLTRADLLNRTMDHLDPGD